MEDDPTEYERVLMRRDVQFRNGVVNAGILDQTFALKWVQTYIHLFGGDPTKVTICESITNAI